MSAEPRPARGRVDASLQREFPALALHVLTLDVASGRSPRGVRDQLRILSNRFGGSQAINLRQQPIPWAYRVFFRHIGLDPDEHYTPVEELALRRMHDGHFRSAGRLADAITIATVETGVAMRALEAEPLVGTPTLRPSLEGERLEGRASDLPEGTLVVADERRPLAELFGDAAEDVEPGRKTRRATLLVVQVAGVPDFSVEEAIWRASTVLAS